MTPGTHKLPPLPYAYDALEPWMGEETVRLHHGKHHQSYVDGLNEAEKELAKARESGDTKLVPYWQTRRAFNEGGHVLHSIWWHCMSPDGGGLPTGSLADLIDRDFGGYKAFRREFVATAKGIEGSGWAVLVLKHGMRGGRLEVAPVHNHENRALWQGQVLLPMDVWEHAYYLDHQNDREGWANTFLDHLVDWEYIGTRLR